MRQKKWKAVIFDLDGTLVDSMWVWERIDQKFLSDHGIQVPDDMNKVLEGKSFTETACYFKERFHLQLSIEEIKTCWNEMAYGYYTQEVTLKTGAKAFLEWLEAEGIKMGIATSNSMELVSAVLKALEIEHFFTEVCTSCEVGRGKPFPDIYLKVAEKLEVMPQDCLVFEDIPNGIRAGKNAGMTAWGIEDRQPEVLKKEVKQLADDYVKDYEEARNKLINKNEKNS